ncbi:MAG: Hint domain-containing protein [Polyangiaceae bacterium]
MKRQLWMVALVATAACGAPSTPAPVPAPNPGSGNDANCKGPSPGAGYECVRDCGPPVAREDDPPPGFSWLSPEDAKNRKQYACPICLPPDAHVATPSGERSIHELAVGDAIWSLGDDGKPVEARVLYVGSTPAGTKHQLVRVRLADGRSVAASPGHPTRDGRHLGALRPGDALSGSRVVATERVFMEGTRTFDVLPSSPSATYWVDGVLLSSSFHR